MHEVARVERPPYRADAAVHHVRWSHEVGAGDGVRERRLDQMGHRSIVENLVIVHEAAVAVRCVFAEAHVCHDQEAGDRALDRTDRALDWGFRIGGKRSGLVLPFRQSEQQDAGDAVRFGGGGFLDGLIH